jgi:hypothetical protein
MEILELKVNKWANIGWRKNVDEQYQRLEA